jgi:sugar/nucleoside kinase (ribokinase family)
MLGQPGATAYIGCIGKDQYGKILRTEAENDGYVHVYVYVHVRRMHARQLLPVC